MTIVDTTKPSKAFPTKEKLQKYRQQQKQLIEDYQNDYKKYWIETDWRAKCVKCMYEKQEKFLLEVFDREIDLTKVETVLEIGCGYGRIAKLLIPQLPHLDNYFGIDISQKMLDLSDSYVVDPNRLFKLWHPILKDFDTVETYQTGINGGYETFDLVISVETMTVLPPKHDVKQWIWKMINLSKKYVINLDWYRLDGKPIHNTLEQPFINNWHDYPKYYNTNPDTGCVLGGIQSFSVPKHENETLFIARVK